MDCGPAALRSLLAGFRLPAGYSGLREACRTDVDGTSIEALEVAANALGLRSVQVMLPADHAVSDGLPALAVVALASGLPHFVIAWRVHGGWVQVMDPGSGRRFVRVRAFTETLYEHGQAVPAKAWAQYAQSEPFRTALVARIAALGASSARAGELVAAAAGTGWREIAILDAAVRTLAAGRRRVRRSFEGRLAGLLADPDAIAATAWFARPLVDEGDGGERVWLRGAVLLRALGRDDEPPAAETLSAELRAAQLQMTSRPAATLLAAAGIGRGMLVAIAAGAVLAGGGMIALYALLERVAHGVQYTTMAPAILVAVAAFGLELLVALALYAAGGRVEIGLRAALVAKLRVLPDRYLRSRPASDLAARAHMLYQLRSVTVVAGGVLTVCGELVALTVGLAWLYPAGLWVVLLAVGASVATALGAAAILREREQRLRDHATALSQLELDAVLASLPARSLRAGAVLAAEHDVRLQAWREAALAAGRGRTLATVLQAVTGAAVAIALVFAGTAQVDRGGRTLLFVVFALSLGFVGQQITALSLRWPALRALALRLCEPLDAPPDRGALASLADPAAGGGACAVALDGAEVTAAGRILLGPIDIAVAPGEHVALVGASGSGKSTLLALALGFTAPTAGTVRVDDSALDRAGAEALWPRVAWVDPQVRVWNATLADNIVAGASPARLQWLLRQAELEQVAARVGELALGDDGGLLSGGEAQRVRFARALARPDAGLVVMDEALRGLDRTQRHRLLARAREHWSDATLLCATHDVREALGFDRVLVLEGGQIVEDGDPRGLAAEPASRLARMIAAEQALRAQLDGSKRWRRLHVDDRQVRARDDLCAASTSAPARPARRRADAPAPARRARADGWLAAFCVVQLARQAVFVASWIVLVRELSSGVVSAGRLTGWALLIACFAATEPLSAWLQSRLTASVAGAMHRRLLAGALRIDPSLVRREGPGRTLGRAFEADSVALLAANGALQALIGLTELLAAVWTLRHDETLGRPLLATLVAVLLVGVAVSAVHVSRARGWARGRAALTGELLELLGGHRARLVYGEPPTQPAAIADYERAGIKLGRSSVLLSIAVAGCWTVGALVVLTVSIDPDSTPYYELTAAIGAVLFAGVGLRRLGSSGLALATAAIALTELRPLLGGADRAPEVPAPAPDGLALTADAIDVFRGERLVLDEAAVTLGHGERLLVTGPSGSGKSTLAEALAGLLAPEAGAVDGHATLVPQYQDDHVLLSSLAFNLSLGCDWPASDAELQVAREVCQELGLGPLLARMPAGLAQVVGESGWQLSNGERSLLGLARALLHQPDVLIVDESLGPLDPATAQRALRVLDARVRTLVVISQE